MMEITVVDLAEGRADPEVVKLVALHQRAMLDASPPGFSFALDLSGLTDPAVTVWAARVDGTFAAIGAMKRLGHGRAEIKSMRTHPDFLRRGIAAAVLETIIATAESEGIRRLSLETGSGPAFAAALHLYHRRGFEFGEAFAGYRNTDFNQCLHLQLAGRPQAVGPAN